eukprot:CAMPEP_0114993958 /NCGR_PEP_ID=MMETSP0216-20121206/12840_1 /TAXON_ID=223996 /ORGANISM="Protocruzia adherens, Strain Boccale" /LENGTH=475 /DNA_ID=CAMNT_0002357701 /DNA_START=76 /DNA_END=1503 /DNA_ORIENTATION=-
MKSALPKPVLDNLILYAIAEGFTVKSKENDFCAMHAPFTVYPTPFPEKVFKNAKDIQQHFNDLYIAVASDREWLHNALDALNLQEDVNAIDEFTGNLLQISKKLGDQVKDQLQFGIFRSDYMLDDNSGSLLQVEFNTMSSSFGPLSAKVRSIHDFALGRYGEFCPWKDDQLDLNMPDNHVVAEVAKSMKEAYEKYIEHFQRPSEGVKYAVLFVVQDSETNVFDQKGYEYELWSHKIPVVRKTLTQLGDDAHLDSSHLIVDGYEIALVYFRASYTPTDFPTRKEWDTREKLELSNAIKCPSINLHLAGTKKVQQLLANEEHLKHFIADESVLKRLQGFFADMYGFERENQEEVLNIIANSAEDYVLKPQREGGGNNIYGEEIREFIKDLKPEELEQYILMRRINPKINHNLLVKAGEVREADTLSELGVFGSALFKEGSTLSNKGNVGHLLRTKTVGTNEGGVAAGMSVLDAPNLI